MVKRGRWPSARYSLFFPTVFSPSAAVCPGELLHITAQHRERSAPLLNTFVRIKRGFGYTQWYESQRTSAPIPVLRHVASRSGGVAGCAVGSTTALAISRRHRGALCPGTSPVSCPALARLVPGRRGKKEGKVGRPGKCYRRSKLLTQQCLSLFCLEARGGIEPPNKGFCRPLDVLERRRLRPCPVLCPANL